MEKAFERADLDWRYLTLEVPPENLAGAVNGMRAMGFCGATFTNPHRANVIEYLDDLSEASRLIGVVNCVSRRGDQLIGDNTDGKGFLLSLHWVLDPREKKVVVLGAGDTARAIAVELGLAGASHITIVNRSEPRAAALVGLLNEHVKVPVEQAVLQGDYRLSEDTEILVNATSIGQEDAEERVPLAIDTLHPRLVVGDVIFNASETRLLHDAKTCGCPTIDGLSMLVNQALISFKHWTNVDGDAVVMRESLEEFLGL